MQSEVIRAIDAEDSPCLRWRGSYVQPPKKCWTSNDSSSAAETAETPAALTAPSTALATVACSSPPWKQEPELSCSCASKAAAPGSAVDPACATPSAWHCSDTAGPQGKGGVLAAKAAETRGKGQRLRREGSENTRHRQCLDRESQRKHSGKGTALGRLTHPVRGRHSALVQRLVEHIRAEACQPVRAFPGGGQPGRVYDRNPVGGGVVALVVWQGKAVF